MPSGVLFPRRPGRHSTTVPEEDEKYPDAKKEDKLKKAPGDALRKKKPAFLQRQEKSMMFHHPISM